ncbi:MAG: SDR family oxidoreductase [Nitrospiraceae bacterium]|nr:MAG: SDR family oxidoreductase [Nitrospiraceae bacterium]
MRTALITGAGGGIGRGLCELFLKEGYTVIGVDCQKTSGLSCEVLHFDITELRNSNPRTDHFFQQIKNLSGGRLDALVNNAAVQIVKPATEITAEDWDITLNTNLLAPFWLVRMFLPLLRAAGGSVVNVSSIHASLSKKEFTAYATSKGALVSLTRSLALELAPEVRVNAVLPAATDTPMLRDGFRSNPGGLEELGGYHPAGRIARSDEVAQAVLFLAGSGASFITGAALHVDGGISSCLHDPV